MKRLVVVLTVALATPLMFVTSASAHTMQPSVSCTQATFTFVRFRNVSHTVNETVAIDGTQVATDTLTFTGTGGTNSVAIAVPVGSHTVTLHADYETTNHQTRTIDRTRRISGCGIAVCPAASSISADFNNVAIDGGKKIWFNSSFRVIGGDGSPVTFSTHGGQVTFTDGITNYTVPVPDATITFSSAAAQATTTFGAGHWSTIVPAGFADDVFLAGATFTVPAGGLPGSINPVTWTTNIQSDTPGVTVEWRWAAAAFGALSGYNGLGVKPLHSATLDQYPNGDEAGTVENFANFSSGGARGFGDGDGHGSNTASASCTDISS